MIMARAATVQALRNRGISKKTAELLADAGFTLEKLAASKVERLAKFMPKKEAEKVLKKLGAAVPEPKPAPKKERAKPAPRGRKAAAKAAEAEPETPLTIPVKAPPLTSGEEEIADGLKEIGRWLPRSVMGEIAKKIHGLKLSKKRLNEVLTKICEKFDLHAIDANESAGIVSAQSIGEPGTQMSIAYDEKIIVREAGRVRVVPIGPFVDGLMDRWTVAHEGPTEWCDLPRNASIEVPSLSEDGKVLWKPVRSASRHRHKNELLRIRTRSGRDVTATANHSFISRRGGRLVPVPGRELQRGDRIPVVRRWGVPSPAGELELDDILPRDRYWYGSEVAKARAMGRSWRHGFGHDFVVPGGAAALSRQLRGKAEFGIDDGCVYPFQNHSRARIPETLSLDASVGWLLGAYLSEGWAARYYVNISNTDESFLGWTRGGIRRARQRPRLRAWPRRAHSIRRPGGVPPTCMRRGFRAKTDSGLHVRRDRCERGRAPSGVLRGGWKRHRRPWRDSCELEFEGAHRWRGPPPRPLRNCLDQRCAGSPDGPLDPRTVRSRIPRRRRLRIGGETGTARPALRGAAKTVLLRLGRHGQRVRAGPVASRAKAPRSYAARGQFHAPPADRARHARALSRAVRGTG